MSDHLHSLFFLWLLPSAKDLCTGHDEHLVAEALDVFASRWFDRAKW
jgi:hypothetical protein